MKYPSITSATEQRLRKFLRSWIFFGVSVPRIAKALAMNEETTDPTPPPAVNGRGWNLVPTSSWKRSANSLVFWVWSHNEDSTEDDTKLHVDIYANGIWNNDIIPPIADMDSMWEEVVIDLDTFLGAVINVRFRMEEFDTGFKHDIVMGQLKAI